MRQLLLLAAGLIALIAGLPAVASAATTAPFPSPLIGAASYRSSGWEIAPVDLPPYTGSFSVSCWTAARCLGSGDLSNNAGVNPAALVATTNGGITWNYVKTFSNGLGAFSCFDTEDCLASEGSAPYLQLTQDGGATWTPTTQPTFSNPALIPGSVACSSSFCLVIGNDTNGNVPAGATAALVSADRGASWTPVTLPPRMKDVQALSCTAASTCYLAYDTTTRQYSDIAVTHDQGRHWTPVKKAPGFTSPNGLSCPSPRTCVYLANQVLEITTDGARSWRADYGPFATHYTSDVSAFSLSCTSVTQCLIGGVGGKKPGQTLSWVEGKPLSARQLKLALQTLDADSTKTLITDGNALSQTSGNAGVTAFNTFVDDVLSGGAAVDVLALHARGATQSKILSIGHAWNVLSASLQRTVDQVNAGRTPTTSSATISSEVTDILKAEQAAGGVGRPPGLTS